MVLVHHKLNPTEKLDLASSLNWTYLTRKERQRVKEMLKESNNNDLLVEMLRWFSLQYRADDEEVVKVTDVLRKHVVNAVRQPRMYQVEYLKEREQWNEFIGKEDADMGGLGGLSTSPSRPSEFITSVTQAMADASLVDNQQKGQPFTSNPKAQLFAPRNLRKRPAAIPVVEGPFTSPSKRQSTSSLPKNQRRQARQAIANIPDLEIQSVTFKNYADRAAFLEASSFTSMGQRQGAANIPNAEAHSFTSMNQRKGTANIPVLQTPSFTSSTGRRRGVANNPGVEARSLTSSQQNGAARVPALETPSITSVNQPQRQAIIPVNNYDFTDEDASTVSDISSDDEVVSTSLIQNCSALWMS